MHIYAWGFSPQDKSHRNVHRRLKKTMQIDICGNVGQVYVIMGLRVNNGDIHLISWKLKYILHYSVY